MMVLDHEADIRNWVDRVDGAAVAGIIVHLGRSLAHRRSALVAVDNWVELRNLRESFLKGKLGLPFSDAELDAAIWAITTRAGESPQISRVVLCYLLAERFGKLKLFHARKFR